MYPDAVSSKITGGLATLTQLTFLRNMADVDEVLEIAAAQSDVLQRAPFNLADVLVVKETFPVVPTIFYPTRKHKGFLKIFEELEDFNCLCVDALLPARQSLFIVQTVASGLEMDAANFVRKLMTCSKSGATPGIITGNDTFGRTLVAFQLEQLWR